MKVFMKNRLNIMLSSHLDDWIELSIISGFFTCDESDHTFPEDLKLTVCKKARLGKIILPFS